MLIFLIIRSNKYTISTFSHLFPYYVLHILDLICCKDRHFSLFFQIILRLFYFFSSKGRYFPKYFVLLQMQPSRLRMIEAKDIRLRTVVLERTDRDETVHFCWK